MNPAEPGLRMRLRRVLRQIEAQHRHLRPIFEALVEARGSGSPGAVRTAFDHYREAIDAHFELEEQFFFPALHGLVRDARDDLEALTSDHERFLGELTSMADALQSGAGERFEEILAAFTERLRDHEVREEKIVASLELD